MLLDYNKIKMERKPGQKQKENPVGCTGEGKRWRGNIKEGSREGKMGTFLEVRWPSCEVGRKSKFDYEATCKNIWQENSQILIAHMQRYKILIFVTLNVSPYHSENSLEHEIPTNFLLIQKKAKFLYVYNY